MKKLIGAILFSALIICLIPLNASAAENNVTSNVGNNSITLDINKSKGINYEIYRNEVLIHSGNEPEFKDTNLESDTIYSYDIVLYNNKKEIVDIVKHKVQTLSSAKSFTRSQEQSNNSYENEKAYVKATVNKNNVKLEWTNLSDDDGMYEIYKDDVKVGTVKSNHFIDKDITNGEAYRYKIIAEQAVSDERKKEIQQELNAMGHNLEDVPQSLFNERKTVIKDVMTVEKLDKNEIKKKDLTPELRQLAYDTLDSYMLRYTTFIPMAYVNNGNWLAGDYGTYLKGDGYGNAKSQWRGFDFFNSSYRTRVDVFAEWYNSSPSFYYSEPSVSQSVLYENESAIGKSCGTTGVRCATASNKDINVIQEYVNNSYIEWRVEHSAAVPFGSSYPAIDYRYDARVYKDGNITATGNHDRAPNHEVYLAKAYTDLPYITLHTFSVGGEGDFYNLFPPVPNEYWQYMS